ncbi:elongation factor P hydroxylase [Gilvimarinus sp. SDUM040013]|uniref:Elongation factor P hydroxylase n=1 Tax=Gilvimarinus gilvus TaxID=3058038 RepID=A0ABU4S5Y1_9GAMM|nr:elongation factor P hydroxylase [Gilvimarinus sp. SDUM040013]MDO3385426.1 elongation factor P hydroxylase [Gilvimarinus sp. SDUM040013]MDX6851313.1 elongation factor P hydroxylase [Gilvimarinus sp. SDUM040013]
MNTAFVVATHQSHQLVEIFNRCFLDRENTRLLGGAPEPLYLPASAGSPAQIHFTQDFFSSALHECAHWCVAGEARRQLEDYGYWYAPDGRDASQQAEFERVEVRPQALEWLFSVAANWPFRVSADNLAMELGPSDAFKDAICAQAQSLTPLTVNDRTSQFAQALLAYYRPAKGLDWLFSPERFARSSL